MSAAQHARQARVGRGPYHETTKPVRVPLSLLPRVLAMLADHLTAAQTKSAAGGGAGEDQMAG